jgi:hypothetical protein
MSRFPQLALMLSLTACESVVPPEPTTPVKPAPAVTPEPTVKPEPEYEEVQLQTRAGPKWVKRPKQAPPRVRVVQEPK